MCGGLKNLVQRLMILGVGEEIELEEVKSALGSVVGDLASAIFSICPKIILKKPIWNITLNAQAAAWQRLVGGIGCGTYAFATVSYIR